LQAPQIKHPHLVLWGEDDIIIPFADMEDMTSLLPNCQLRIFKNVGHSMIIENPDLYAQIFTEYFSR
jgi:non-heme chloroperoxidase